MTGFALLGFTFRSNSTNNFDTTSGKGFEIPENIQKIVDKSCYDCHYSGSQSEKGKKKLEWDKMGKLKTYKLVGKLADIADVVNDGDMPPEDFLNENPEAALTAEEKEALAGWAESTAKSLSE